MKGKVTTFLGMILVILVIGALSTSTVFAEGATKSTGKIFPINSGGQLVKVTVGEATLILKNGVIKIEAKTKDLAPGHVFSVWGKINGGSSFNVTGFISDDDGTAGFSGTVQLAKSVRLSRFDIIIKDHGDPIKGLIHKQMTTKTEGCNISDPKTGENICIDVQKAVINTN